MPLLLSVLVAMGVAVAPGSAAAEPAEEKQVCKRVKTMETGSTIRERAKRVCRTVSEWKEIEAENRRNTMRERTAADGGSPR